MRRRRERVAPRPRGDATVLARSPVPAGSRRVSAEAAGVATPSPTRAPKPDCTAEARLRHAPIGGGGFLSKGWLRPVPEFVSSHLTKVRAAQLGDFDRPSEGAFHEYLGF